MEICSISCPTTILIFECDFFPGRLLIEVRRAKNRNIPLLIYCPNIYKLKYLCVQACGREWRSDKIWDQFIKFEVNI